MNPLAWILDSLKTHPEPAQLPDLTEATPLELAEARSRLATFAQVATELRRLTDRELAERLDGKAFRYGEDVYRPSNGKGSAKVQDAHAWWHLVATALSQMDEEHMALFLNALYPASSVRLTALPKLAENLGIEVESVRDTFIVYDPPTSPLSVMPRSKAPKFLQDMEEGEIR